MDRKIIIFVGGVVILGFIFFAVMNQFLFTGKTNSGLVGEAKQAAGSKQKSFSTQIANFKYAPEKFTVNQGDTVQVTITNKDTVTHGVSLQAFGVKDFIQPNQTKTIQFVATQKGSGETFCNTDHGEKLLIEVI